MSSGKSTEAADTEQAAFIRDQGQYTNSGGAIEACLTEYGPSLVEILVAQIGGEASRSELDDLCEPLKALAFRGGPFQAQLRQAVASLPVPANRVSASAKNVLSEQVMRYTSSSL